MAYKEDFATNQINQEPFFKEMVDELAGGQTDQAINGRHSYQVTCPLCSKRKSRMYASKRGDTWMFGCPRFGCRGAYGWGCNLHQLIQEFGSKDLQQRWSAARSWTGIQNRTPRGANKPPLTELEKLQIRAMVDGR